MTTTPRMSVPNEHGLIGMTVNCFPTLFRDGKHPTMETVARRLRDVVNADGAKKADRRLKAKAEEFVKRHNIKL